MTTHPTGPRPAGDPPGTDPFDWLDAAAEARAEAGLTRRLRARGPDDSAIDLAGNDYLGLARHPAVTGAAAGAAERWGAGSTGSRLVTGSTSLHAELEHELADLYGTEAALVFSSGYTANLGMVTSLSDPRGRLLCDRYNHASLIDGTRLAKASGTRVTVFPHGDIEAVRAGLAAAPTTCGRQLVLTDTVFSVDGDITDIAGLAGACREHGAALLLDDAHGLGVVGERGSGSVSAAGLRGAPDIVVSVTLSKALGAQGGAVLGTRRVVQHLTETARSFVFDTGLAPPAVAGALAALRVLRSEPERAARARATACRFAAELGRAGLATSLPRAAVVSVRAPSPTAAVEWAERCRARGVRVGCFRPPSVPDGHSRLRLTARGDLTESETERALETITRTFPGH